MQLDPTTPTTPQIVATANPTVTPKETCGHPTDRGVPCPSTILLRRPDPDGKRRCAGHAIVNKATQKANGAKGKIAHHLKARRRAEIDQAALDAGEAPFTPATPKRPAVDLGTAEGWREQVSRVVSDVLTGSINPGQASAALAGMRLLLDERSNQTPDTSEHVAALLSALEKP